MITNLEEFYKKIQNPILDENNFDSLIGAYANHNFLDSNYQGSISNVYTTGSNIFTPDDLNEFYAKIFNYWKKHLTTREIANTSPWYSLQQYFKNIGDVTTWKDAVAAFPHKRKTEYLDKFLDVSKDHQRISSVDIHEQDSKTQTTPFDVEHILYVNVDLKHLHKFASEFLDKCEKKNLPYLFEIQTRFRNDKSFAISSDSKHLLDYYQILQEIIKEDKELKEHIYHPPVFSGIVDGWIGYESAEVAKSKDTEKFNHLILSKGFKKMVADQPKLALEDEDGEKMSIVDLASSNVVYSQIDYLSKIDRKQLKEYYNLKPRDLKSKKFLNSIFSNVKEEMLKGIKNKSFKFDDVVIDFRKRGFFSRKKVHKDGITISHQDLERSLSKTLQNITQDYPKTKSLLQKGILKMADEKGLDATTFCMTKKDKSLFSKLFTGKSKAKKDKRRVEKKKNFNRQTAQDFTNFFCTTSTKLLEDKKKENNPFLYHLTKDQIIQDLPINSKEESRFKGVMSEDEIRQSQIKLGFISPNLDLDSTYRLKKDQIIQDLPINSKEESRYQGVMTEQEIENSKQKIKTFCKK